MDLVRKWNKTAGLVAPGDLKQLEERHLNDSLALVDFLGNARTLLDVGTGGGFPGIPLAIAVPHIEFTLVERNLRKCSFLRHVVMTLNLTNVDIVKKDVRELARPSKGFDVITARAVASPHRLWEWCRPLLAKEGRLLLQLSQAHPVSIENAEVNMHSSSGVGFVGVVQQVGL